MHMHVCMHACTELHACIITRMHMYACMPLNIEYLMYKNYPLLSLFTHTLTCLQAFGAKGLSCDTPLAQFYSWARILRLADGPDEVHTASVGKLELKSPPT